MNHNAARIVHLQSQVVAARAHIARMAQLEGVHTPYVQSILRHQALRIAKIKLLMD